jgi:hypothetical protein
VILTSISTNASESMVSIVKRTTVDLMRCIIEALVIPPRNPVELMKKINWLRENYELVIPYMSPMYSYAIRTEWHRMARRHLILYYKLFGKEYSEI